MCSPRHRPIRGPWNLWSALMFPPLLQPKPGPKKLLPAPVITQANHTASPCPRSSLRHLTSGKKVRRPSRRLASPASRLPPSLSLCPTPSLRVAPGAGGAEGGPRSSSGLIINSYQEGALGDSWVPGLGRGLSWLPSRVPPSHLWGSWEHRVSPAPPAFPLNSRSFSLHKGSLTTSSTAVQLPWSGSHSTLSLMSPLRPARCLPTDPCQAWFTFPPLVCAWPRKATMGRLSAQIPLGPIPAPATVTLPFPVLGHGVANSM